MKVRTMGAAALAAGVVGAGVWMQSGAEAADAGKDDPALARARETTLMLDALYKNVVVSITENYVAAKASKPAAVTVKPVFAAMEKGGFHTARLLDGTGSPLNSENSPKDDFEKAAVKKIMAGAASHEQVETVGDKRFLRTATVVPIVMKQCIVCHAGKVGDPIGALVYRVPVK